MAQGCTETAIWEMSGAAVRTQESGMLRFGSLALLRDDHFNDPMLGFPFCLKSSLRIDFERTPAIRVSHKFLHDLDVLTICH